MCVGGLPCFALSLVPVVSGLSELYTHQSVPVVSVPSEVRCAHSPVGVDSPCLIPVVSSPPRCALSPQCFGFGLDTTHTSAGVLDGRLGGKETEAVGAGEFPKVPPRVFFFLEKSSCSILPLHTRKGLSSHTAHLSS